VAGWPSVSAFTTGTPVLSIKSVRHSNLLQPSVSNTLCCLPQKNRPLAHIHAAPQIVPTGRHFGQMPFMMDDETGGMSTMTPEAQREKKWVASTSVAAAVGLAGFKLVIGLTTGSLGILAEAAHSSLDLAAAIMTLVAVCVAARPADRDHLYGHGKVENISALFQTLLLLVTCAWIVLEATHRLRSGEVVVEVTAWSFVVMLTSIAVDVTRSRILYRAARKHNSQALEADALHFSTDIYSSAVVLVGLAAVLVSRRGPEWAFLKYADAVAAIMVAVICLYVIFELGMRSIYALIDSAPAGMESAVVAAAEAVPGVTNCHRVRIRASGPQTFIDAHVLLDGRLSLQQAHDLTDEVEHAVQAVALDADVTVHAEPAGIPEKRESV
jgi:cation diffusion facilitator family transporter